MRLAVVYRGRALLVVWRVLKRRSASIALSEYREMLVQAADCLPGGVKVVLLADRGFVHVKAMQMMSTELGWHYRIRLKRNAWVWRAGQGWQQLNDFHLQRGEALCLHTVKLHKQAMVRCMWPSATTMSTVSFGPSSAMNPPICTPFGSMAYASILRKSR